MEIKRIQPKRKGGDTDGDILSSDIFDRTGIFEDQEKE